jgi:hypothetical protein
LRVKRLNLLRALTVGALLLPSVVGLDPAHAAGRQVITGDVVLTTDNATYSGFDVRGNVQVRARNVTIKDSIIRGSRTSCTKNSALLFVNVAANPRASLRVSNTEIAPTYPSACIDGMWLTNTVADRVNVHGTNDGIKAFDDVTITNSWIHDLDHSPVDPNQDGGPSHNDAIQSYAGNRNVTIRGNALDLTDRDNAAIMINQMPGRPVSNLVIADNRIRGGQVNINLASGYPTTGELMDGGVAITGNVFGSSEFNVPVKRDKWVTIDVFSGNTRLSGASVSRPAAG